MRENPFFVAKKMRIINTKLGLKINNVCTCVCVLWVNVKDHENAEKNYKRMLDIKVNNV